jgi:hypothetical protein
MLQPLKWLKRAIIRLLGVDLEAMEATIAHQEKLCRDKDVRYGELLADNISLQRKVSFLEGPAQVPDFWTKFTEKYVSTDSLPDSMTFYRDCSDIANMAAFSAVLNHLIKDRLKNAIQESTDGEHFKLFVAAVLSLELVKKEFERLGSMLPKAEEPFDKHEIL